MVPNNQIINTHPFSDAEVLKVEREITASYIKRGVVLYKMNLEKASNYVLQGSALMLNEKNNVGIPERTEDLSSQLKCSATKSLNNTIRWSCTSPPSKKLDSNL